ncbi:MAG TPA: O-antigen ligase family protein [Rhodospirillaceae bacterium]|nr:O-antigen ligase family protein [Rhodospirillaceae bacterium]
MTSRPTADLPLALLAVAIPVLQAYSTPLVVPLLAVAALAALLLGGRRMLEWPSQPAKWLALWFLALLVVGVLSAAWSVQAALALRTASRLGGLGLCILLLLRVAVGLDEDGRRRLDVWMVAGLVAGLVNLQVLLSTQGALRVWLQDALAPVIGVQRPLVMPNALDASMTFVGLLIWPVFLVVLRRHGIWPALLLLLAVIGIVAQGFSLTAMIALLAGAAMGMLALLLPRKVTAALAALVAVWMVAAPLLLQPQLTARLSDLVPPVAGKLSSFEHRRAIWGFVAGRIAEKPLTGWGLGSSREIPGGKTQIRPGVELLPLHPHDAALQIWLELGVPGAILGVVFVLGTIGAIGRNALAADAYATSMALFAASTVNAMASYSLWHEWWMCFLILAGCFQAAVITDPGRGPCRAC